MTPNNTIEKSRRNVMMRISVFLLYYILMLLLTFILLLLVIGASIFAIFNITYLLNRLGIIVLFILGVCWVFVIRIGFGLLKSPFIVSKYEREDHLEVTEEQCPQLFQIVREVADFTRCEMPKHVYLCSDVNACLFYNTSFWNIFFPVQKQLEIGVGLINGMSTDELKSIIAHEFGHYSQNTEKIDGIINRTLVVLDNMMRTLKLPGFMQQLTHKVYRFVERGHLRFSRQLEYNADSVACSCVGKEVFISALCKTEILQSRQNVYKTFISDLLNHKIIFDEYWSGYNIVWPYLEQNDTITLAYDIPLVKPFYLPSELPSRLRVNNIWSTHPSLEDRISEAQKTTIAASQHETIKIDARTLIHDSILHDLGVLHLNVVMKQYSEQQSIKPMTPDQFREWVEKRYRMILIPSYLVAFLQRDFFSLVDVDMLANRDQNGTDIVKAEPFTVENMSIVKRYQAAVKDLSLMQSIQNGEYEVTEFLYNGKLYNKKNNPVEQQAAEVEALRPQAAQVDNAIMSYLLSKTKDKSLIVRYYNIVRYTQQIAPKLSKLTEIRNSVLAQLNAASEAGQQVSEAKFKRLIEEIKYLSVSIGAVTRELNYDLLTDVLNAKSIAYLADYHKIAHCNSTVINPNKVNAMSRLVNLLYNMHADLYNDYSNKIIYEIQECFSSKAQQEVLLQHIHTQSDFDYGFEQKGLDAEFMERIENSESKVIGLYLVVEILTLALFLFIIHASLNYASDVYSRIALADAPVNGKVHPRAGEIGDGIIAITIPEGFEYQHYEQTGNSAAEYFLSSEGYDIEIFDGYKDKIAKDSCTSLYWRFVDSRGYPINQSFISDTYSSADDVQTFHRLIKLQDVEYKEYFWDFKIIYDSDSYKYIIVSSIRSDTIQEVDITKNIRMK